MNAKTKLKIIAIIKEQPHRLINVKFNQQKRISRKGTTPKFHPLVKAYLFIDAYDNPVVCYSTEEKVFSAMQEGRE